MTNKNERPQKPKRSDREKAQWQFTSGGLEAITLVTHLGLTIAIPIVIGAAAGHWLDEKLGTGVIFSLILLMLGIVGGLVGAYRLIVALGQKKK